jgi:aryl-alcohol dehydrogenase-like predicted oxidoreductase
MSMAQKPLAMVRLGECGPKVSRISLSGALFGEYVEDPQACRFMARFQEAGGNFIDATGTLGGERSERVVGRALKTLPGEWIVATGTNLMKQSAGPAGLGDALERSLSRLGLSRVDIYYLRCDGEMSDLEQIVEAIGGLIETGKVRHWGFARVRPWMIAELIRVADCLDVPRPVVAQPYYHALYRKAETDYLPACAHFRVGTVAYAPLARGLLSGGHRHDERDHDGTFTGNVEGDSCRSALEAVDAIAGYLRLSGRDMTKFAVQWVLANRLVSSVLIRPQSAAQLEACLSAAELPYTLADESFVDRLVPSGNGLEGAYRDPRLAAAGRALQQTGEGFLMGDHP